MKIRDAVHLTEDERWLLDRLRAEGVVPMASCVARAFDRLERMGLARCERGGIAATPIARHGSTKDKAG